MVSGAGWSPQRAPDGPSSDSRLAAIGHLPLKMIYFSPYLRKELPCILMS